MIDLLIEKTKEFTELANEKNNLIIQKLKYWIELLSVDGKNTKLEVKKDMEYVLKEVEKQWQQLKK